MNRQYSFQKAPRCSATSKRTRERCKAALLLVGPASAARPCCANRGDQGDLASTSKHNAGDGLDAVSLRPELPIRRAARSRRTRVWRWKV
jgi:hypothetical protein